MNNPEMIPQEISKSSLTYKEVWETLSKIDVSTYLNTKGQFSYLSWSYARAILSHFYPQYRVIWLPSEKFEDGTMLQLEHPNQLMDYYQLTKDKPAQSKITTDVLRELIDKMNLDIHPSHIRSAIDGILGNPIRYEKAESTKRNIRRLRQAIRNAAPDKTEGLQQILSDITIEVDLPTASQASK